MSVAGMTGRAGRQSHETAARPTFAELYTPKLITVLREGYGLSKLRADVISGLTVAIVALPLSMGIAIASGAPPERGLYTAIVGGFLVSLLGGSRFQIGGPAGAFIVLVASTVARHGLEGLALATLMSGLFMLVVGYARLGTYIKFIPYPVTVGFTAGIAVIIFASQIHDLFGLTLSGPEPGDFVPRLKALAACRRNLQPGRGRHCRSHHRHRPGAQAVPPRLAGIPRGDRRRIACRICARPARRDDRQPLRRHTAHAAAAGIARAWLGRHPRPSA